MESGIKILIHAVFEKQGPLRYISHLDLMRFIYRALRRSALPYCLTQGFNPRPRVSFGSALKVGEPGRMEVVFHLTRMVTVKEFADRLSSQLLDNIKLLEVRYE